MGKWESRLLALTAIGLNVLVVAYLALTAAIAMGYVRLGEW